MNIIYRVKVGDSMKNFHNMEIEEVYKHLNSSEDGLTDKQVKYLQKKQGLNEITEYEKKSKARMFLEQFEDFLVIILIASAFISMIIGELASTIVIFFVIILNSCLGTYQQSKSQKSLEALKVLSSPNVTVIRNKEKVTIHASHLVVGDIVLINKGDMISADGRLIEANNLEVNESSLTGEALPVYKNERKLDKDNIVLSEKVNMVYSGTFVTNGSGKYIVSATGMNTEIGKIAKEIASTKTRKTPLQNNLDEFSRLLAGIIIFICIIVFLLGLKNRVDFLDSLMFAVALAVAAIPEALSTIVVIVLAIGTERMAKENAIIKELKSVEALGCINYICTDKTGTLTENKMVVKSVKYLGDKDLFYRCLYNTCKDNGFSEMAINEFLKQENYVNSDELIDTVEFTSSRKMMSSLYVSNNKMYIFAKGAGEVILSKVNYIKDNNLIKLATSTIKDGITKEIDEVSEKGFRVLVFAYKEAKYTKKITEEDENEFIYLGYVALYDPIRKEAYQAVKDAKMAGINVVMLTGDHKNTACYIAKDLGILEEGDLVLNGDELDKLSDRKLKEIVSKVKVYSRLTPHHKLRIVKALQDQKGIVAMTGDGINDAPALKNADIGISMGKKGTEVAKEASSMILTDDNFSTIIKAIANGRNVYQNIQNAIRFLLSGNFAGIIVVLIASFLNLPLPFLAVHLLFINLLTDSLPAIAIGMEDGNNKDLLKKSPRKKDEPLFTKRLIFKVFIEGIILAFFIFYGYMVGLKSGIATARTMAFAILCLGRLFHSFNCVRAKSIFICKFNNLYLIYSVLIGVVLMMLVLKVPFLNDLISVDYLSSKQIIMVFLLALLPTFIIQSFKIIKYAN